MKKDYKRCKKIMVIGIVAILIALTTLMFFAHYLSLEPERVRDNYGRFEYVPTTEMKVVQIVMIVMATISITLSVIGTILILTSKFENKEIEDMKIVMGILSLVLTAGIGLIIFGLLNMKKVGNKKLDIGDLDPTNLDSII